MGKLQRTAGFQTIRGGCLRTTEISTLIPTVTDRLTAHRQTDQRALVEIIQRPSVRAGSPVENLSVRPTVRVGSAGGLKRGTVASQTDRLREFIYKIRTTHVIKINVFLKRKGVQQPNSEFSELQQ